MSHAPRLSKNSMMLMTTKLNERPSPGTMRDSSMLNKGQPVNLKGVGPSISGKVSLGSSVSQDTLPSPSTSSLSKSSPLGPSLKNKNGFSTQQVVDEANMDNFTTVTTKMKDMVSLLEKASDDDKTLVLFELQQVVEFDRNFVVENILPVICANADKWEEPVQTPAAEALSTVLRSDISSDLAMKVCHVACNVISKACDQANRDLWGEVLVCSLKYCSWSAQELDRVVNSLRGNPNIDERYSVTNKLIARILGAMAISSVDQETKKVVLERAVAMTTDSDHEVRGIIAESMAYIGGSLTVKEVEVNQWPTLHRLSQDENACVRGACLKAIADIAEKHKENDGPEAKLFRYLIPSLFYKECTKMRRLAAQDLRSIHEDIYLIVEINSEIFGRLLSSTYEHLPDDTSRKEVYKAFLSMATCNSPIIRKNCASSLPQAAECFGEKCAGMIANLIEYLSHDSDDDTRWTVASRLHETLPHMANRETIATSFKAVLVLLRDKNYVVRQNLMQNFQSVVAELSKYCTYNASSKMSSLFEQLQLLCDFDWRSQELLVKQLQLTAHLVPPTTMTEKILPLLNRISRDGTYLVRKAAMGSIATYIRFVPDSLDRDREMKKFCEEWAHGNVYWMRMGFIDAAKVAVGLYSRCLFRDCFGLEVLKLAEDSVSNVRLRVAMLLSDMAPACYMMDAFDKALDKLKQDGDIDVREAANNADGKIGKSITDGRKQFEADMEKEEEERELFTRHLQNQREANKKKSTLKKAAGGWWQHKMAGMATKIEEVDSPVTPAKNSSATPFTKSNSVTKVEDSQRQTPDETKSTEWESNDVEPLYLQDSIGGGSKDDSDIFRTSRSFRGFRPFLSGKGGALKRRNSVMIKK